MKGTFFTTAHTANSGDVIQSWSGSGIIQSSIGDKINHRVPDSYYSARIVVNTIKLSSGSSVYVDNGELRPANLTMRIWKRIA